ncbi:MAG: hypothetical protein R3B71_06205 [Candidatus Gracilibacteria bacterium]|nr:hypothetical protein [Candidatus Peregrinibacteria bacterium]
MSSYGDMPESNDRPESYLADAIEKFEACEKRTFQRVPDSERPEPDPEQDVPMNLTAYKQACREAEADEILSENLKQSIINSIQNADNKNLTRRYPTGQRLFFALVPKLSLNEPTVEFYQLYVTSKGLTYGYTPDPGYYYKLLPTEVQEACTFQVPFYDNMHYPTDDERQELIARASEAFDNLKRLLS